MADEIATDPKKEQAQTPTLPPLDFDDNGADYEQSYDRVTTDLPIEQPLMFYIGHQKAFYLPRTETDDESTHITPQTIFNPATKARILPVAYLRQGEANATAINIKILDDQGPVPLSEYTMISFRGDDNQYHPISDDEGWDTTQASLGEFIWKPSEPVALTSGKYHTAQIVIETQDRTKRAMTLDFDLHIIPNNVAFPRPMAFYFSEYQRALFNIGKMQAAAYKHAGYMINFLDQVTMDALAKFKKSIDDAMDEFSKQSADMQKSLDGLETNLETLKGKETDYETDLNTKLADLKSQMNQLNLVTQDTLKDDFLKLRDSGDIDVSDPVSDDAEAIIKEWSEDSDETK